ncbi:2-succinylbenzoate--CoA ligase [Leptothermofonsia sp. ETS-13]|uniref:2-succinylbenzoate--CoA ligase n=1 Tax=Leptothermofonsia sp. ETS-13 TaxID=3035696 RepID=UPI003B9E0A22
METPLACFNQRITYPWLVGYSSQEFANLTQQRLQQLSAWETPPRIFLAEQNPVRFLSGFIAACIANCPLFLGNFNWATTEWQQVLELAQPNLIWQAAETVLYSLSAVPLSLLPAPRSPAPILIPTGGTSGKIRFTIHTWQTLMASVQGFQQYFELTQVNSFCVLPLYHVSGLMQFLRSFTSGGRLVILPFKAVEAGEEGDVEPETFFLSLVPTQLQRLMNQPERIPWLSRFQTVLVGGAPAWSDLLETARQHRIPLAPTYGMTETASQVATLKPEEFLEGKTGCGQVLPHAQITICSPTGDRLGPHQTGIITVWAKSLALGYYPNQPATSSGLASSPLQGETPEIARFHSFQPSSNQPEFQTDDLGFFDEQGCLHVVGRTSDKIITGGENVFPAEIEATIRATGLVQDVCVLGMSDRHWGQIITAVYVPSSPDVSQQALQIALSGKLSKFKQPKQWIAIEHLPRNAQGKIEQQRVVDLIQLNKSKEVKR